MLANIVPTEGHNLSNYIAEVASRVLELCGQPGAPEAHDGLFIQLGGCSLAQHVAEKGHYVLFQPKDTVPWLVFLVVFLVLIVFDNLVLHRKAEAISFARACTYSVFWVFCGVCWNLYVYYHRGWTDAISWTTGYLLEWMLSMDCLFFFHIIFKLFGTPDHLKHIPLFWGIVGAIVFRLFFFLLEEVLMHSFYWTHFVFGVFLIYTGVKSASISEEHFDPRQNALFIFLTKYVRLINGYDTEGRMFVRVPLDAKGEPIMPKANGKKEGFDALLAHPHEQSSESDDVEKTPIYTGDQWYSSPRGGMGHSSECSVSNKYQWRGTLLCVVVMCIMITDLIFAVDSVSAVVAEVPDLFLAYTASVFAVLNLRAMFFVTDQLIKHFVLLKYGIASILIIIGVKLMMKEWVHIPAWLMLTVLISIVAICILGSLVLKWLKDRREAAPGSPYVCGGSGGTA